MLNVVVQRVVAAVAVIFLSTLLVAGMLRVVPGDAATVAAGENATAERVAQVRHAMGLDKGFLEQYGDWLGGVLTGDFGTSLLSGRPVWKAVSEALPVTLSVAFAALAMAVVLGVAGGVLMGLRKGTWVDRLGSVIASLGISTPGFWVGLVLMSLFALTLGWLPAIGYRSITNGVWEWARHLLLPGAALALVLIAEIMRQTRSGVIDALAKPYILTARAKGVRRGGVIRRHVLRNASIPVVTVVGLQAGQLLGGVILIEVVFGMPGLGTLAIGAVQSRDFPTIQAYILLTAVVVVVINLVVDLSYGWINPRVRGAS